MEVEVRYSNQAWREARGTATPDGHVAGTGTREHSLQRAKGRLLSAGEIARDIFGDPRKQSWVRHTIPHKITMGRSTVRWFEQDVLAWIESCRDEEAA